jgi:hypothetical protein
MFDTATSTIEYRPSFGRRTPAGMPARQAGEDSERCGSVDAFTAALRQRILAARPLVRLTIDLRLAQ